LSFLTGMDADYQETTMSGSTSYTVPSSAVWGTGLWGTALWGGGMKTIEEWTSPQMYPGVAVAAKIQVATKSVAVQWMASDYVYEYGGVMG
jgi:hypothetical protein